MKRNGLTPGPSALRLDRAASRAGISFSRALEAAQAGEIMGFTSGGYWFVSEAAVEVLRKLKPDGAVGPGQSSRLEVHNKMDTSHITHRTAGLPPMPPEVAAARRRAQAAQDERAQAEGEAQGIAQERARTIALLPFFMSGAATAAEFLALLEANVSPAGAGAVLRKIHGINGTGPAVSHQQEDADFGAAMQKVRTMAANPRALVEHQPVKPAPDPELDKKIRNALRRLPPAQAVHP